MNDGNTKLELAKDKISSLKKNESYLGITEDDMGKSYYYRGNVKDNYVNFNNMCFRIFRIEGDGSIKLVLEDSTSPCNIDTNNNNSHIDSSSSFDGKLTSLNNWFKSNFKDKNILNKIKKDTWCIEDETKKNNEYYTSKEIEADYLIEQFNTSEISLPNMETLNFFFDSYNRNLESSYSEPNLKCSNSFDSQIGTLTADELVLAGGNKLEKASGYLDTNYYWWTLTAYQRYNDIDYIYVYKDGKDKNFFKVGSSNTRYKNNEIYLRPVITILNGVELEKNNADGTKEKPYVIRL